MSPTALLALAAQRRSTGAGRPKATSAMVAPASRARPSGARLAWHVVAALAGGLILVVSLVDPLRGSDRYDIHAETREQGVRHE